MFVSVFAIPTERRISVSKLKRLQSSEQAKEKEREKGGGEGALITAGIEEKRAGPYQVKMPYTFGDEDRWFPEGDDNAHIRSK